MARFGAPHGVYGLIKVHIFSRQPDFFLKRAHWWCQPPAGSDDMTWRKTAVEQTLTHSGQPLVKLANVTDRDAAARWCNGLAAVEYHALPALEDGAFYWCDLIGLQVQNARGEPLGEVVEINDIGAHDVLCAQTADGARLLIPFVDKHVLTVDIPNRLIIADWERDW